MKKVFITVSIILTSLIFSNSLSVNANNTEEIVDTIEITHEHSGSQDINAGCYIVPTEGTKNEPTYDNCKPYYAQVTYQHKGKCPSCNNENLGHYTFRDRHPCDTQWGNSYTTQDRCSSVIYL